MKAYKRQRRVTWFLLVILMTWLLVGCGEKSEEVKKEDKKETKAPMTLSEDLSIGIGNTLGKEVLDQLPSDYNVKDYPHPKEVKQAFLNGEVDLAVVSSIGALELYQQSKGNLVIISPVSLGGIELLYYGDLNTEDISPAYVSPLGIHTVEQQDTAKVVLDMLTLNDGGSPPFYQEEESYEDVKNSLSYYGTYALVMEPYGSHLLESGDSTEQLFSVDDWWSQKMDTLLPTNVMVAKKSLVENRPQDIKVFIGDYEEALTSIENKDHLVFYGQSNRGKAILKDFYQKLYDENEEIFGYAIPDEAIYYNVHQ